ncbi:MAG: hypothetical protein SWK90_01695 [Chloroflexota bacterium]|nr:hypothetical protein [Chloroflexota bacterium]
MAMTELIFTRHWSTDANIAGRREGWSDGDRLWPGNTVTDTTF